MALKIRNDLHSPTFGSEQIRPEQIILHATHCSAEKALQISLDPAKEVSFHYLIDSTGEIRQLLSVGETVSVGYHAGTSLWAGKEKTYDGLNRYSVGIELVNLNGNLFPYTKSLMDSLTELIRFLCEKFPELRSPNRILGHEQIAGFRGKVDPGIFFPWKKFYRKLFPGENIPPRPALIDPNLLVHAQNFLPYFETSEDFAPNFSQLLEQSMAYYFRMHTKQTPEEWGRFIANFPMSER